MIIMVMEDFIPGQHSVDWRADVYHDIFGTPVDTTGQEHLEDYLGPEAPAFGLLLVLPSRAYRRSFSGAFAAAAGIPAPTARRRFDKKGCM